MVKQKSDENKIIVVGIPEGTDAEALEAMFSDVGKVLAASVVGFDKATRKSRGYGFVTFASEEACLSAITKMHKTSIEGRTINVRMVEERTDNAAPTDGTDTEATSKKGATGKDANKVLVAGITASMTDERLQLMCEQFGLVIKASVVCNPTTGKSRGFGFVTFTNRASQQACITMLDKRELGGGRVLNVRAVETRVPDNGSIGGTAKTAAPTAASTASPQDQPRSPAMKASNSSLSKGSGSSASASQLIHNVCRKFQVNKCHRGRSCRWRHEKIPRFKELLAQAQAEEANDNAASGDDGSPRNRSQGSCGGAAGEQQRSRGRKRAPPDAEEEGKRGHGGGAKGRVMAQDLESESSDDDATLGGGGLGGQSMGGSCRRDEGRVGGGDEDGEEDNDESDGDNGNVHHRVANFSDSDDSERGGKLLGQGGYLSKSGNAGVVSFDDGGTNDEDVNAGTIDGPALLVERRQVRSAFDSDDDTSSEEGERNPRGLPVASSASVPRRAVHGKALESRGREGPPGMDAEASRSLSIMASLFERDSRGPSTNKPPPAKKRRNKGGAR